MQATRYEDIINGIPRAKGILGHPLILSFIVILYQSIIIIKSFIYQKFNFLAILSCLIISALTTSRTTVILIIFVFCYYYITSKMYKSLSKNIVLVFVISCCIILFHYLFAPIITNISERFNDGANHRLASYPSVMMLFMDNPLGVGYTQVTNKINEYATINLIRDFPLDNFFLTQIAAYGIISIIVFKYYFYYVIIAFKLKRTSKVLYKSVLLLFFIYSLVGFSFNIEAYIQISLTFYGFIGYLFSHENKQTIKLYDSHNNNKFQK